MKENRIGLWSLTALVFSSMVGAGIFSLPQNMATTAGAGAILIGWLITGVGMLALAFVFLRVLYIVMYVGDMPMARSMIWAAGFAVNIGIFFLGYH